MNASDTVPNETGVTGWLGADIRIARFTGCFLM